MRIIISGTPGSGKSTASRLISKKLGLNHFSMGDFQRQIAKEKGISINKLSKLEEIDDSIDKMVDEKQKAIGIEKDNFVLDSRLGTLFIPHSDFKIFIDCNIVERARRVYEHKREDETGNLQEIKDKMIKREESESKRFKEFYDFDYKDPSNYDIIIDSTHLEKDEVAQKIIDFIEDFTG